MFYLTYRPKTIGELDNTNVQSVLENLLKAKTLPHALLFVGQKGTGKTSTARIFAKSVNCLQNKYAGKSESIEPCNTCANCLSIDTSGSPDVVEMDAASNRGIDEVRSLIKEAAFMPMVCRYRVFIIDEAHMITTDAFNAFLKTLEEPPESVLFIFATTNEEKVPKTIISRCFRVPFGSAQKTDIVHMLKRIAKSEGLELDERVFELISRHSEKSFRDTTKLLEELVIQHKTSYEDALSYIGVRGEASLLQILDTRPLKDALIWVEDLGKSGGSVKAVLEELLQELKASLLAKNGIPDYEDALPHIPQQGVMKLMRGLTDAYQLLKSAPIETIPLEIALVEFYNLKK